MLTLLLLAGIPLVTAQQNAGQNQQPPQPEMGGEHVMTAMSSRHVDMGPHMKMTPVRALRPGDQQRADDIAEAARETLAHYTDYKVALADGYHIFLPKVPAKMYHFTNWWYGVEAAFHFNPEHPTSLLYEKTADGYKLIGAMYTAPANASLEELDSRIPLSIAQWHEHVNFCQAPKGRESEYFGLRARFGLLGSITTKESCEAAGGTFKPRIFGWMVHVYPFEHDAADIWSVERQENHGRMDHAHMKN